MELLRMEDVYKRQELQSVFANVKEKLDESRRMREQRIGKEKEFQEILPELQEQFWVSILVGGLRGRDSILRKKELLSLDFSMDAPCAIVNVTLEMSPDTNELYYQQRDNRYNLMNNIFGVHNEGLSYYQMCIRDRFQTLIVSGVLEPDSQMPSVRSLAMELSINPNTIQKAYSVLEQEGYIYPVKGRGNFVSGNEGLKVKKQESIFTALKELVGKGRELDIPCDAFVEKTREFYLEGGRKQV